MANKPAPVMDALTRPLAAGEAEQIQDHAEHHTAFWQDTLRILRDRTRDKERIREAVQEAGRAVSRSVVEQVGGSYEMWVDSLTPHIARALLEVQDEPSP